VVDASRNFRKEERSHARRIAALNRGEFVLIYIDTPEREARKRLRANRQRPERVDWGDASFDEIVRVMEPPGDDENALIFHYEDDVERWISKQSAVLTPRRGP
jgi:predicted kinase